MTFIVNLSTISKVRPISDGIKAFAKLCDKYSTGYLSSCSTLFKSLSNYAWVMYKYKMNNKKLIQPYKLGAISTEQFLHNLLQIFSFLKNTEKEQETMVKLNEGESYTNDFALSLLENAWNETIDLDKSCALRFQTLIEKSKSEPVYLISNTNELNVLKILRLLKNQLSLDINFNTPIDLSVQENKEPIEIAPNIFLCLSYRYQLFKTTNENRALNPQSTMSLINYLIKKHLQEIPTKEIFVISQFTKDLEEAAKIGIPKNNVIHADDFFKEIQPDNVDILAI